MGKRVGYIDIMKGVAIICVLIGHYVKIPYISAIIWSFHMPLFIFLNGYFFKEIPIGQRIKKSFGSYMKPYIIVWFLLLLLESITALIFSGDAIYVAKNRFLSGFWALASNSAPYKPAWVIKIGVIWFLNALFIGTILMSIAVKIRNKISQLFFVVIIFAIAMIQTANICLPLGINYGAAFLMWLWIGQWYSTLKTNGSKMIGFIEGRMGFLLVLLLWGAIVLLEFKTGNQYNICWIRLPLWGLELLGAFCGIIVIMGISRMMDRYFINLASAFRYLGTISLWILCVHAIDVELFPKVANSFLNGGYLIIGFRMFFDLLLAISLRELYNKIKKRNLNVV